MRTLHELLASTHRKWETACGNYALITYNLSNLRSVLLIVLAEVEVPSTLLQHLDRDFSRLEKLLSSCNDVVNSLDKVISKYNALSRSPERNWERLRQDNTNIDELNTKLISQSLVLYTYLDTLGIRALGAREDRVLRNIIKKVDKMAWEMRVGRRERSTMAWSENGSREDWRQFCQELTVDGFSNETLERFYEPLCIYLRKMNDAGLLEESVYKENREGFSRNRSYQRRADDDINQESKFYAQPTVQSDVSDNEEEIQRTVEPKKYSAAKSVVRHTAIVQCPYEKVEKDDLELRKGEQVTVIDMANKSWWMGRNSRGEAGLFPSDCVKLVEGGAATPAKSTEARSEEERDRQHNSTATEREGSSIPLRSTRPFKFDLSEWWGSQGDFYTVKWNKTQQSITYEALPISELYPVKSDPWLPEGWDWWLDPQNRIIYIDLCPAQGHKRCFWKPPIREIFPEARPPPGWLRIETLFGRVAWLHVQSGRRSYRYPTYNVSALFHNSMLDAPRNEEQLELEDKNIACQVSQTVWNNGLSKEVRALLGYSQELQQSDWISSGMLVATGDVLARHRNKWLEHASAPAESRHLWHTLPLCAGGQPEDGSKSKSPEYCWRSKHLDTRCQGKHVDKETLKAHKLPWHHVDVSHVTNDAPYIRLQFAFANSNCRARTT